MCVCLCVCVSLYGGCVCVFVCVCVCCVCVCVSSLNLYRILSKSSGPSSLTSQAIGMIHSKFLPPLHSVLRSLCSIVYRVLGVYASPSYSDKAGIDLSAQTAAEPATPDTSICSLARPVHFHKLLEIVLERGYSGAMLVYLTY
jgi:hypothetical protein